MDFTKYEKGSYPPWSRIPALQEMTEEAGVDFDQFIQGIKEGKNTAEMAREFQVSQPTIALLEDHFWHYGISSVTGGD